MERVAWEKGLKLLRGFPEKGPFLPQPFNGNVTLPIRVLIASANATMAHVPSFLHFFIAWLVPWHA